MKHLLPLILGLTFLLIQTNALACTCKEYKYFIDAYHSIKVNSVLLVKVVNNNNTSEFTEFEVIQVISGARIGKTIKVYKRDGCTVEHTFFAKNTLWVIMPHKELPYFKSSNSDQGKSLESFGLSICFESILSVKGNTVSSVLLRDPIYRDSLIRSMSIDELIFRLKYLNGAHR